MSGQTVASDGEKLGFERFQILGQAPCVTLLSDRLIKGAGISGRRCVHTGVAQQLDALLGYMKTVHCRPGRHVPFIADLPP